MWRTFRPILALTIALGIASQALAAGVISPATPAGANANASAVESGRSLIFVKTKYPRTPIGVATTTTVERHVNAAALIQGKKKVYAQGSSAADENNGDDTAYDLKLKLQVRKPAQ